MSPLDARTRARLPNTAFAYIDSRGRRRLPIHDEAHVRNALARFERTVFESDAAKERARKRLLAAAKKHGIVPIGFITSQLRSAAEGQAPDARSLPTGSVTFLLCDIEDSTSLVQRLGDRYADVLGAVRDIVRSAVRREGGGEVDARADEYFAAFERPTSALAAAVAAQRALAGHRWPDGLDIRVRMGLHTGDPALTDNGYVGLAVHVAARVCSAAHGGQILVSEATRTALDGAPLDGTDWRSLGAHRLHGLPEAVTLFQVVVPDLPADFPPPRAAAVSFTHLTPPAGSHF